MDVHKVDYAVEELGFHIGCGFARDTSAVMMIDTRLKEWE